MCIPRRYLKALVATIPLAAVGLACAAVEDRINDAVPLSKAAQYARSQLLELAAETGHREQLEAELNAKLRVRAIECAAGYTPSPFVSHEEIAAHFSGTDCFERKDEELARWIGWRRVWIMVRMPPLRPVPTVVPRYLVGTDYIQQIRYGSSSGVLLLWTYRTIELLDMSNGKRISHIEGAGGNMPGELSPNGRVLTLPAPGSDMSLVDVETGESLARVPALAPTDFNWLGPDHALILRAASMSSFTVDFDSGTERAVRFTKEPINRIVPTVAGAGEYLALTSASVLRLKLDDGRVAEPLILLEQKPFAVQNWLRTPGIFTADGRTYVIAAHELNFISAKTLTTTTVPIGPFDVRDVEALPNPDLILLSGENPGINPNTGLRRYVYSLSKQTFAPVNWQEMEKGRIVYVPTVNKLAVVSENRVGFIDTLPTQPAISREDFVAAMNLEQEQHQAAMSQQSLTPHISGEGPVRVETIPGARVTMRTSGDTWTVTSEPDKTNVEAIGIEHAASFVSKPDGSKEGIVLVHVKRGNGAPIVLLLSSHDSVRWSLTVEHGATLQSILTAGPGASEVSGAGSVPVRHLASGGASQMNTPEYERLQSEVFRTSGSHIRRFQGVLVGGEFTVEGR